MRCLYCGKELALLKRWTGGGEFCSDAHRQQYQEEYNQLALNRLLQAKPGKSDEKKADARASDAKTPEAKADPKIAAPARVEAPAAPARAEIEAPAPQPAIATAQVEVETSHAPEPEPVLPEPEIDDEPAPAEAYGFVIEMPVSVEPAVAAAVGELGGFDQPIPHELPRRTEETSLPASLVAAGQVEFAPYSRVMDYVAPRGERHLELREFARSLPAFKFETLFDLAPASETGVLETSEESMEILMSPQPPQSSLPVWLESAEPFTFGHELGALARVTFRTTGIEDKDEDAGHTPAEPAPEPAAESMAPDANQAEPVHAEPPAKPASSELRAPAVPIKVVERSVSKPAFLRPAAVAEPSATHVETPQVKKAEPVPDVMTKPLPIVLHGLTAGRGKPVQVFPTAVAGDLEIQAPRSSALPLRPVMTLGPAPALAPAPKKEERKPSERTVLVKSDPRKSPQGKPDTRFAKRKPELEVAKPVPEPAAPKVAAAVAAPVVEAPKEAPKPAAAAVATPTPVQTKQPEPPPKPAPTEAKSPEPVARPTTSLDLGLPKLTVDNGGFWAKLPPAGKIGIAAALVLAVVGLAIVALRGSGSTVVANGPQVVAGSPLPAMDSGWITDWGAEPGVRREREISILRPSLNLSDYRMEFQAEIEGGKALGWVFRAKDGKNFYVAKLEVVTPGLQPKVDVVHFAVIDGQPQARARTPLPMNVRIDTLYRIRFDAVGDHFSTFVQDEKVDDWTDDRLKLGGVGLYSDRGETMPRPRAVSVVPLVIKR